MKVNSKDEAIYWNLEHYNSKHGVEFDKTHIITDHNHYTFREIYKDILSIKKKITKEELNIFDIACGTGKLTLFFMKHFPKAHFYALDLSQTMLDNLKSKVPAELSNQVHYECSEVAQYLKTTDIKFDIIMMTAALHHFYDYLEMVELTAKLPETGSIIYICNEPGDTKLSWFKANLKRMINRQDDIIFSFLNKKYSLIQTIYFYFKSLMFFKSLQQCFGFIVRKLLFIKDEPQKDDKTHQLSEVHETLDKDKIISILENNGFQCDVMLGNNHKYYFYHAISKLLGLITHFKIIAYR
jgi:ubiquinone/menaquinone biosynthesis C-methylase UbiE